MKTVIWILILGGLGYGGYYIYQRYMKPSDVNKEDLIKNVSVYFEALNFSEAKVEPYTKGKIVFICMDPMAGQTHQGINFEFQNKLPDELRARNDTEVGTIVYLHSTTETGGIIKEWESKDGTWLFWIVDRSVKANIVAITIMDRFGKKIIGRAIFKATPEKGWPVKEVLDYLKGLPKKH